MPEENSDTWSEEPPWLIGEEAPLNAQLQHEDDHRASEHMVCSVG